MLHLPALLPAATAARWHAALEMQPGASLPLAQALDLDAVLQVLRPLRPHLPPRPRVITSQCWVRRATPPHSWHQDGALHHDFRSDAPPLPMWTAWLPLVDCNVDAPGLEWVDSRFDTLLPPAALARVHEHFPNTEHPPLQAGDALLFDGGLLHRSHVTAAMTLPRTSIELRFIADGELPARLAGETLRAWP
ncbi:MAG: hypothetical protein WAQ05_11065 [Rubrivivax sp.]